MNEPHNQTPASTAQWRQLLFHPVTVVIALWAWVPLGISLLLMNPALRKDRRWWAGAAVWVVFLFFAGRWSGETVQEPLNEDLHVVQEDNPFKGWAESESEQRRRFPVSPQQMTTTAPASRGSYQAKLHAFLLRQRDGMPYSEVLAILGPPSRVDSQDIGFIRPGVTHKVAIWDDPNDDGFLALGFNNNRLSGVKAK